eukprot:TRINITY_DN4098_c0_g1_i3.p1 TRINITY_DN4098_c0_g1~~TRINITY_DN4098_c0_g1_i3.p1  ORF type:complete len:385 (+),score=58.06 TRINITY_DN4098_c0_g1_i3:129-1283(+)
MNITQLLIAAVSVLLFVFLSGRNVAPLPPLTCPTMGHILVTGGAGYIGSHAALRLLEKGYHVTVIDDLSRGDINVVTTLHSISPSTFRFVQGSISDRKIVTTALESNSHFPMVDAVFHFSALAYVGESTKYPLRYYENITSSSITLLDVMERSGVMKLLFSSTCAVYGSPAKENLPVTEQTPTVPISPYGKGKLWVEEIIRDQAKALKQFDSGILRYFNVYGCDPKGRLGEWPKPELQQKHGRITNACLDAAQGTIPEVRIIGTKHPTPDGTCVRDFIHVSDLVEAHILMLSKLSNPPTLYNVGTGFPTSVRQLVAAAKTATSSNFTVREIVDPRPGDPPAVFADPTLIKSELGWRPLYTDPVEGLRDCWNWRVRRKQGLKNGS